MKKKLNAETPKHLTPGAARLWELYTKELQDRGTLQDSDFPALERLCILEREAYILCLDLANSGMVVEDKNKDLRRSPKLIALVNVNSVVESLKKSLSIGHQYRKKEQQEPEQKESIFDKIQRLREA